MTNEKELAYRHDLIVTPRWRERFDRIIDENFDLPDEGRFLILNCGTGSLACGIAQRIKGGDVYALDSSVERLELARALAIEPRLLLLDEVLAGLNPSEIRDMVPIVRSVRDRGITILMIEHVMQAVMNLAQQVWVLAQGQLIAQGTPAQVTRDDRVIEAYLGHGAAARLRAAEVHA